MGVSQQLGLSSNTTWRNNNSVDSLVLFFILLPTSQWHNQQCKGPLSVEAPYLQKLHSVCRGPLYVSAPCLQGPLVCEAPGLQELHSVYRDPLSIRAPNCLTSICHVCVSPFFVGTPCLYGPLVCMGHLTVIAPMHVGTLKTKIFPPQLHHCHHL